VAVISSSAISHTIEKKPEVDLELTVIKQENDLDSALIAIVATSNAALRNYAIPTFLVLRPAAENISDKI
jgi:hypothetical protein